MNTFFKSKFQEFSFVAIILLAFSAFYIETDIYTPSFPEMMHHFGTNENGIQLLLSMNFLGLCLSCLFLGPASDAYGRKRILCGGLTVFMLGSIGCALTDSLNWMILFRFLQGAGCGSITSAALTMFFDVYPPEQSPRLVALCNGTIGGLMALAPLLGNWISLNLGWRVNFYLIAALASLSCFCVYAFLRETLPVEKRTKLSLPIVLKNYALILTNFPFMSHTMIWCLAFSMVIVFIANLSLIFVDYLGVSQEIFGVYQTAIMGAYFVGSIGASVLINKIGLQTTKLVGSFTYLGGVLMLSSLTFWTNPSPILLIAAMAITSVGSALAMTIYFAYSMTHLSDHLKGSAMSLTQSLRLLLSSALIWVVAQMFDGTTRPMTSVALVCTAICLLLYAALYQRRQHQSPVVSL